MRAVVSRRVWAAVAGVAGGFGLCAPAVSAPALMEKAGGGETIATIYIADPGKIDRSVEKMADLTGYPIPFRMNGMMAELGDLAKHLRTDAPVAMSVRWAGHGVDAEGNRRPGGPVMMMFIPVKDYAGAAAALKTAKKGDIDTFDRDGTTLYMRDIGDGYAAACNVEAEVAGFKAVPGGGMKGLLSPSADKVTRRADFVAVLNFDKGRDFFGGLLDQWVGQMRDNIAMVGRGGQMATMDWALNLAKKEAKSLVIGLSFDADGTRLEVVPTFMEGSRLAKVCSHTGASAEIMAKLPMRHYVMAGAADLSNAEWKKLMDEMPKPEGATEAPPSLMNLARKATGAAVVMGFNPGGIAGGLMNQGVVYLAGPSAQDMLNDISAMLTDMPKDMGRGKLTKDAAEVGGQKVDRWDITMNAAKMGDQERQVAAALFGGTMMPSGYLAKGKSGVYMTTSRLSDLMGAALTAETGGGTFLNDAKVKGIAQRLPGSRMVEAYIGFKGIVDTVTPLMKAAGVTSRYEVKEPIAPVAFALATGDGSAHMMLFVPDDVIKSAIGFYRGITRPEQDAPNEEKPMDAKPAKNSSH